MDTTITWIAVTTDTGGGALTGLTGYKVYHGTSPGVYDEPIIVLEPTVTKAFTGLYDWSPHYFAVSAYDPDGNESAKSAVVSKQIYFRKISKLSMGASSG